MSCTCNQPLLLCGEHPNVSVGGEPSAHRASPPAQPCWSAEHLPAVPSPPRAPVWLLAAGTESCWRVTQSWPAGTAPSEFVPKPAQVEAELFAMDVTPQAQPCSGCRITTPMAGQKLSPNPASVPGPNPGTVLQEQSTSSPSGCKWPHKGSQDWGERLRRWETACSSHIKAHSPTEGCQGRSPTAPTTSDWQWL